MSSDENDLIKAEAARYKRATDAAAKSRATLTELVLDALREPGAKPAAIASRAEWTPAYVRKLARENGIEADPAYKARTEKAKARVLAEAGASPTVQAAPKPDERPSPPPVKPIAPRLAADLTSEQLALLAERAFRKANTPEAYALLTAVADKGDRAVVEAAMTAEPKLLTATDVQLLP